MWISCELFLGRVLFRGFPLRNNCAFRTALDTLGVERRPDKAVCSSLVEPFLGLHIDGDVGTIQVHPSKRRQLALLFCFALCFHVLPVPFLHTLVGKYGFCATARRPIFSGPSTVFHYLTAN